MKRRVSMKHLGSGSDILGRYVPKCYDLALSATGTNKIKKEVTKILNYKIDSTLFLNVTLNKSNSKLVLKNSVDTAMFWLIDSPERLG